MAIFLKILTILFTGFLLSLSACGDADNAKVSKGHREAIQNECGDESDKKLCNMEVTKKFLDNGNQFVNLKELNKDQINRVKMECIRSKKYGLESYNNCLGELKRAALDGTLTQQHIAKKPKDNIEKLEQSTVYVEVLGINDSKKDGYLSFGHGSGVMIDNNLIATNCHVAITKKNQTKTILVVFEQSKFNYKDSKLEDGAEFEVYKKNIKKDICILRQVKKSDFKNINFTPVKKFKKFKDLKRGDFVRTFGNPRKLVGHTDTGSINWIGTASIARLGGIDEDTKIIIHSAIIDKGNSGGPLFDNNGYLIGLNTAIRNKESITVSADHISELLK